MPIGLNRYESGFFRIDRSLIDIGCVHLFVSVNVFVYRVIFSV